MHFRLLLIQKGCPLSTQGKPLLWVFVASPEAHIRNSHVLLEAPVLGSTLKTRSSPSSLNLSSVGVQDISRSWAAAQNVTSEGRKRLLAELKMKTNWKELESFEEIKGG